MSQQKFMAMALDPSLILKARGMVVDPWQRDFLLSKERQILLNCTRQAGKSTVVEKGESGLERLSSHHP